MLGTGEMFLVLVLVLVLFGPERLPALAKSLGEAVYEFRKALHERGRSEEKPAG